MSNYQGLENLGYPDESQLAGDLSSSWPTVVFGKKPKKSKKAHGDANDFLDGAHGGGGGGGHSDGEGSWIYSYGDMVTNLLMFFIMLVAVSKIDENKYQELTEGLKKDGKNTEVARRSVANFSASGQTPSEMIVAASDMIERVNAVELMDKASEFAKYNELKNKVTNMLKAYGLKNFAPPNQQTFEFIVPANQMFAKGSLTKFAHNILSTLIVKVRELPIGSMRIQVDVHEVDPSLHLQTPVMATTIAQHLVKQGIPSETVVIGNVFRSKAEFKNKIRFKISRDVTNDRGTP